MQAPPIYKKVLTDELENRFNTNFTCIKNDLLEATKSNKLFSLTLNA